MFASLVVCHVVVVSHVLPTGLLVIFLADMDDVLSFFATSVKRYENFVLGMESWAWN